MTANVTTLSNDFGIRTEVPLIYTVVVYDCPIMGVTSILIINNILYIREMAQNIIPHIMMYLNGVLVDKCPKFLLHNPTFNTQSIFFPTEKTIFAPDLHVTTSFITPRRSNGTDKVRNILI